MGWRTAGTEGTKRLHMSTARRQPANSALILPHGEDNVRSAKSKHGEDSCRLTGLTGRHHRLTEARPQGSKEAL